ncbi:MAG: DUF481 domain-containing protein [Halioglobus sp.]|nr:DUF481 domain-containing protein [Halioglobus sp.]
MMQYEAGVKLVALITIVLLVPRVSLAEEKPSGRDRVILQNGSQIIGTVVDARGGTLTMETDFAGTLSIGMDHIASVEGFEPVVVLLDDKSSYDEPSLRIEEDEIQMAGAGRSVPLAELSVINPEPWELGQGYKWGGLFGMGFVVERGNTDTDELDVNAESVWRSTEDRYTLKWTSEQDKNNNVKTKDTWQARAKYDYFLTDPNYVGLLAMAESDKFQDLNLRYLVGPYYGRQFYDEPVFTLSGELGLAYVNEDFDIAEDQDYPAANWSLHASSDRLGGDSSLYFDQTGIWNLDETSDVIVNTTFGLSFPMLWQLEAAAEILLEYDSGAVEDVDDLDQTYKFRINYTW